MAEPGRAELAARRVLAGGAAAVALIIGFAMAGLMVRESDLRLPGWFFTLALLVLAAFIGTGVLAPWLDSRQLRRGAVTAATGYLLLLAAFVPAASMSPDLERVPWMLSAASAAVGAALLARGPWFAWTVLIAAMVASTVARGAVGGLDLDGIVNDTQVALASTVVCVVGRHVLSISRELDHAAAAASIATAAESAERGRLAARTRAAALVHDEVLATLSLAGSGLPIPADRLAAQAADASAMVSSLVRDHGASSSSLAADLAAEAARAGAEFRAEVAEELTLEPPVHDAFVAAARQALENSVRHAGASAHRRVTVRGDESRIEISIADDGVGFDPGSVPADRLGLRTSIVGRMRDIAGGAAEITSTPGRGTVVTLTWGRTSPATFAVEGDRKALNAGLLVVGIVYVLGQAVCAVAAAWVSASWEVPLLVLAALLGTAEVLRFSPTARPGPIRTAVFVTATVAIVAVGLSAVPFTFGTTWFVTAAAFLLVALAMRERVGAALAGLGVLVVVVASAGAAAAATPATIAYVMTRPALLIVLAVALIVAVGRMQRRTADLHAKAVATVERTAWDGATQAELAARVDDLDRRVVPMLDRIARGGALTAEERRVCVGLEGELRDEYRAGALAREPLTGAARAARERGIDVVLLDDRGGLGAQGALGGDEADRVAHWMATRMAGARSRVVGRLLPPDREAVAAITVDAETTHFGG